MAAQFLVDGVVNRKVVGGEQVGECQRSTFGGGQVRRVGWTLQGTHRVLGEPVVDGALVANGHAASALVVERDAQPDQLEQPGRKRSGRPKGRVECAESLGDLSQPPDNGRDAEVDPITLPEVDNGYLGKCG